MPPKGSKKRKKPDPRRRSFFTAPPDLPQAKDSNKGRDRRSRNRRQSTSRKSDVFFVPEEEMEQSRMTTEDGFKFQTKRSRPTGRQYNDKESRQVEKKRKTRTGSIPKYPSSKLNKSHWSIVKSLPDLMTVIIQEEKKAVTETFNRKLSFVSDAIGEASMEFLMKLANLPAPEPAPPAFRTNPQNTELATTKLALETFIEEASEEIKAWEGLNEKNDESEKENDSTNKPVLLDEDKKWIEGDCSKKLTNIAKKSCVNLSIKTNKLLNELRKVKKNVHEADKVISDVCDSINKNALGMSLKNEGDQIKNLIQEAIVV